MKQLPWSLHSQNDRENPQHFPRCANKRLPHTSNIASAASAFYGYPRSEFGHLIVLTGLPERSAIVASAVE